MYERISYRDRPDGLLAIAQQKRAGLDALPDKPHPFFLLLEGIEKPGNLGTLLRSSTAFGVDGVILCNPTTDLFNPNVIRASVGALFSLPVVEASPEKSVQYLKERKVPILATTPPGDKTNVRPIFEVDLSGSCALLIGSEQYGLSDFFLKEADQLVTIPMREEAVDSLNAAQAATITLYERSRQLWTK